jgi:hypothetical protein
LRRGPDRLGLYRARVIHWSNSLLFCLAQTDDPLSAVPFHIDHGVKPCADKAQGLKAHFTMTCHGIFLHLRLASGLREGGAMKRTIRIEEQIIGILQGHEAGAKSADLCRKHGMSEGTCLSLEGEVFCCDPR